MEHTCPACHRLFVIEPGSQDHQADSLPFCSARCKLIDLAAWLDADYSIPAEPEYEQPEQASQESASADGGRP